MTAGASRLDFAATNVQSLLDWYLALSHLVPNSSEPLLGEPELRKRIEGMLQYRRPHARVLAVTVDGCRRDVIVGSLIGCPMV